MTIKPLEIAVDRSFQAAEAAVFEAILETPIVAPAMSKPGDIIEVVTLEGTPLQAGHRATVRINHGAMDLQFIDTLHRYDPPHLIKLERLPQGAFHYDHTERLPPDVWDDFKADPEQRFRRLNGDDPQPQNLEFAVHPDGTGTRLTVHSVIHPVRRMTGWGRWRAIKQMKAELIYVCDQIGHRL